MTIRNLLGRLLLILMLWLSPGAFAQGYTASIAGQLPLAYRLSAGGFPWTGQLHAITFRTSSIHTSTALTRWEAGALLDRRDIGSRRLYLGGKHLTPFHWHTIDAHAQAILDGPGPGGNGAARLAWLRGSNSDTTLRKRDTRLGSGAGARVHVVPPPAWLPMQPGHTAFRLRHAGRSHTVWVGTRDGIMHGFDAVTGKELAGFLPRTMLPGSAALTAPRGAMRPAPCPRPDSIDADPSGVWRTLLLCGVPSTDRQKAAVFVLDVSSPDSESPIGLIWETPASDALPLSGAGPIRAVMWIEHGARRWAAMATLAPAPESGAHAGLALLPLDRPVTEWADAGTAARLLLPQAGCGTDASTARLLAASVRADASGRTRAAYAIDNRGRLWRFGFEHLGSDGEAKPALCLHRQGGGAGAEPPVVVHAASGPLIVYASGGELSAIPDRPGPRGTPARIDAVASGDGVVLRAGQRDADRAANGWTLALPHPDESVTSLESVSAVHLGFTTLTPDGRTRSYLIDAASGESVTQVGADGTPAHAVTGFSFDERHGKPVTVVSPVSTAGTVKPGHQVHEIFEVGMWHIDGDTAHLMQQTRYRRRRGRLGWRELIRTGP